MGSFYYAIGLNQFCIIHPKRQIPNYIMEKFDLEQLLMYTENYKPFWMLLSPPMLIELLSKPDLVSKYDLSSVCYVTAGGAPLRKSAIRRFEAMMPHPKCHVYQGWGMTEITCIAINRNPKDVDDSGCTGEPLPNVEAKVVAPDGVTEITSPYTHGEIWIRSPNVAKGYWRDPESTSRTFYSGGWVRTDDFGYFDEQSRMYVSDRIQDITSPPGAPQGTVLLPTDLEMKLLDDPRVLDAGIVKVAPPADMKAGEKDDIGPRTVPRGFVVLDKAAGVTVEDVAAKFADGVKPHERLAGGLFAVTQIPRLPIGKVNRVALRAMQA